MTLWRSGVPCIYCGHPAEHTDHIVARSRGGGGERSNLAPACRDCNFSKGARSVEHFLRHHPEALARVRTHQSGQDAFAGLEPGEKPRGAEDNLRTLTMRLPLAVHDQLREMAFTSRRSQHSLMMDALNLLFERDGDPPIAKSQ